MARPATRAARRTAVGTGAWRFVAATLASCALCLGAVLALNLVLDPFAIVGTGLVPSAVETDRATKLTLVRQLDEAPDILILGSSRARQADPSWLRRLTGHGGFNAGVTGGTAADAWVFTRFTADRFPGTERRYIWFVDAGIAVKGVNPQLASDPRARRYLQADAGGAGLSDIDAYLAFDATRASLRLLKECVIDPCDSRITFEADGSIPSSQLANLSERTRNLERAVASAVAGVRATRPGRHGATRRGTPTSSARWRS